MLFADAQIQIIREKEQDLQRCHLRLGTVSALCLRHHDDESADFHLLCRPTLLSVICSVVTCCRTSFLIVPSKLLSCLC